VCWELRTNPVEGFRHQAGGAYLRELRHIGDGRQRVGQVLQDLKADHHIEVVSGNTSVAIESSEPGAVKRQTALSHVRRAATRNIKVVQVNIFFELAPDCQSVAGASVTQHENLRWTADSFHGPPDPAENRPYHALLAWTLRLNDRLDHESCRFTVKRFHARVVLMKCQAKSRSFFTHICADRQCFLPNVHLKSLAINPADRRQFIDKFMESHSGALLTH